MAIVNGYATIAQLREELGIADNSDQTKLETAIAAASRQIDGYCGRRFWQDATVITREFIANDSRNLEVPDISTTTGLVVKTDTAGDGTYATTLAITTNYLVTPFNAADSVPVWPYTGIALVDVIGSYFPVSGYGRPGVQVTAKWGWPAIPDAIFKACLIQSTQLYKASDAVFGGIQIGDGGVLRVRGQLNPMAAALCDDFVLMQ